MLLVTVRMKKLDSYMVFVHTQGCKDLWSAKQISPVRTRTCFFPEAFVQLELEELDHCEDKMCCLQSVQASSWSSILAKLAFLTRSR